MYTTVTPSVYATTPASVTVALRPETLTKAGQFTDQILFVESSNNTTATVTASITVVAAAPSPTPTTNPTPPSTPSLTPSISRVVNAATYATGAVAPGEIITIFGTNLGPPQIAVAQPGADKRYPTSIGGTRVLMNGTAIPLLYSMSTQVSAVVPYEAAQESTVKFQVAFNGNTSAASSVPIGRTSPALFTVDASGDGVAAALNEDYALNRLSAAAHPGRVLMLYGTGDGIRAPLSDVSSVSGADPSRTSGPVSVYIDNLAATVLYAGGAPGLTGGLFQVNAVIPNTVGTGYVPVKVKIGSAMSPDNVGVWVEGSDPRKARINITTIPAVPTRSGDGKWHLQVLLTEISGFDFNLKAIEWDGQDASALALPAIGSGVRIRANTGYGINFVLDCSPLGCSSGQFTRNIAVYGTDSQGNELRWSQDIAFQ